MKSTGVVRRVGELGRIVIPIELRRNLNLKDGWRFIIRSYFSFRSWDASLNR